MPELLSICIPTFNRAPYLSELLELLVPELVATVGASDAVRLYISDNASTDDTPAIIDRFASCWPLVRHRQSVNIGPDRNFADMIALAQGTYFWLIGDDELLAPGFLPVLLRLLQPKTHDLILLEPVMQDGGPAQFSGERESMSFASYADFIDHFRAKHPWALMAHSLISTMVIKRAVYDLETSARILETIDRSYAHMYALVAGMQRRPGSVHLELHPTLVVRTQRAKVREISSLEINRLWRRYYHWLGRKFGHPELIAYGRTHFGWRKWWRMHRQRLKRRLGSGGKN